MANTDIALNVLKCHAVCKELLNNKENFTTHPAHSLVKSSPSRNYHIGLLVMAIQ